MHISAIGTSQPQVYPEALPFKLDNNLLNLKSIIFNELKSDQIPQFIKLLGDTAQANSAMAPIVCSLKKAVCLATSILHNRPLDAIKAAYSLIQLQKTAVCQMLLIIETREFTRFTEIYDDLSSCLSKCEINDLLLLVKSSQQIQFVLRYNQLSQIVLSISPDKRAQLAFLINNGIECHELVQRICFKKTDLGSPFSLQIHAPEKVFIIKLKNHTGLKLNATGGSKKVTTAISVPFDIKIAPTFVGEGTNKTSDAQHFLRPGYFDSETALKLKYLEGKYQSVKEDLEIHRRFAECKGIWPLYTTAKYTKKIGFHEIPKISFTGPLATNDLSKVTSGEVTLRFDHLLKVVHDLSKGLHVLHNALVFHGDLKDANCLYQITDEGMAIGGLIDFGHSFTLCSKKRPYSYGEGYYGTIDPTPPEMVGVKNFEITSFRIEDWAFGYLMHQLFFKTTPSWKSFLPSVDTYHLPQPSTAVGNIRTCVIDTIETPRKKLKKITDPSLNDKCALLVYNMLRLKPSKRFNIEAVVPYIEELRNQEIAERSSVNQ